MPPSGGTAAAVAARWWQQGVGDHRVHRTWMRSRVGVAMVANYSLTFQSYFSTFDRFRVAPAELPHNALIVLIAHLVERIETTWHTSSADREQIAWIPSALAALTCTSRDARDAIAGEAA